MIHIYLNELLAEAAAQGLNPDTLVLGCTHYPLLRPLIEQAVRPGMQVIDSAESAAQAAVQLINRPAPPRSAHRHSAPQTEIRCFATDSVEKFERLGSRFLGRPAGKVELVDLAVRLSSPIPVLADISEFGWPALPPHPPGPSEEKSKA